MSVMLATQKTLLSPEEYLVGEAQAEFRHEYVAGEVYAMAGASERHNRISGNLYFQLRAKARGSQRGVFMNDMKLRIQQGERFYYPDVMLGCNPDDSHEFYKDQPCLIAEVLSPSTETTDRREKWLAYAQIPSLRYYLLVETNRRHVEFYQRGYNGQWQAGILQAHQTILVECGQGENSYRAGLCLDDIYEDVRW